MVRPAPAVLVMRSITAPFWGNAVKFTSLLPLLTLTLGGSKEYVEWNGVTVTGPLRPRLLQ